MWKIGELLTHRFNPDLGPGRVVLVEGRSLSVEFPARGTVLSLTADAEVLLPLEIEEGTRVRLEASGELASVQACLPEGRYRLRDGRVVALRDILPLEADDAPVARVVRGDVGPLVDLENRLDALDLAALREADGLGSFLGGRIRLFPHQLYAAEKATAAHPVRWLLADEVGLGKTVEACLVMNHLLRTGRADRTLVVAPATLAVQWLGELWRKYHQVFVLLDEKRRADVAKDHGEGFNPFDAHHRTIVTLEDLVASPRLVELAVEAGLDLLVVDEAHHLKRPPGHPGNPAYRAAADLAAAARHTLLLTATPLEDDAHGFFRLLQLLRPDAFPEEEGFEERLAQRKPLPPCTSAARRVDIGGLPPRKPMPVDLDDPAGWAAMAGLERAVRSLPAPHAAAAKAKAEKVFRALASPAALAPLLGREPGTANLRDLARRAAGADPRVSWLLGEVGRWKAAGEKTLLFVAYREILDALKKKLEGRGLGRVAVFHEDLSPGQRDIEVAQFRLEGGPSLLISTECGGEGRNFEFCRRLVLFDLPWNPAVVEQRIGRLDRIGREIPTEVVYFKPPSGLGAAIARLYEAMGLFEAPLGGIERELRHVAREVERLALEGGAEPSSHALDAVLDEARQAFSKVQEAAHHELHRDPYRQQLAAEILARVPPDLETLTEKVVVKAAERLGLGVERQAGERVYGLELGSTALVESLPGVPGNASFLGTFDRAAAVERENLDFYASGHPLVEGILAELEDGPRGRVALFQLAGSPTGFGLLALYKKGPDTAWHAVDLKGRNRPDWVELLREGRKRPEHRWQRVKSREWTAQKGWEANLARMAEALPRRPPPIAVAAFRVVRPEG